MNLKKFLLGFFSIGYTNNFSALGLTQNRDGAFCPSLEQFTTLGKLYGKADNSNFLREDFPVVLEVIPVVVKKNPEAPCVPASVLCSLGAFKETTSSSRVPVAIVDFEILQPLFQEENKLITPTAGSSSNRIIQEIGKQDPMILQNISSYLGQTIGKKAAMADLLLFYLFVLSQDPLLMHAIARENPELARAIEQASQAKIFGQTIATLPQASPRTLFCSLPSYRFYSSTYDPQRIRMSGRIKEEWKQDLWKLFTQEELVCSTIELNIICCAPINSPSSGATQHCVMARVRTGCFAGEESWFENPSNFLEVLIYDTSANPEISINSSAILSKASMDCLDIIFDHILALLSYLKYFRNAHATGLKPGSKKISVVQTQEEKLQTLETNTETIAQEIIANCKRTLIIGGFDPSLTPTPPQRRGAIKIR